MFIFDWHLARGFLDADDDDEHGIFSQCCYDWSTLPDLSIGLNGAARKVNESLAIMRKK